MRTPELPPPPPRAAGAAAADALATRQLVTRLATVAVQGEQLQSLCDELRPVLEDVRRDPRLQATAAMLAAVLAEVAGIADDIAQVTETLGQGLQQARPLDPGGGGAA